MNISDFFPVVINRKGKIRNNKKIREKILIVHPNSIITIGVYGSLGLKSDMPYSDIELLEICNFKLL